MAFSDKHLHGDERIVLDLNPHWWFLVPRALILVAATVIGVLVLQWDLGDGAAETTVNWLSALLVLGALGFFALQFLVWRTTNFVVTTDRCIYRSGLFRKAGIEIPLDRINTVFFNQGVFERLIGAGDISIESAGETGRQTFSDILNPLGVQRTIYEQMEEDENRRFEKMGGASVEAPSAAVELGRLADLLERGAISQAEYDSQKAKILGG